MTAKLIATWTRPDISILWPFQPGAFQTQEQFLAKEEYFTDTYINTGLCISRVDTVQPGGLICISEHVFVDEDALLQFQQDDTFWHVHLAGREEYIKQHNLTIDVEVDLS